MRRCVRCRSAEIRLVRFGVYVCPTCGPLDADGRALSPEVLEEPVEALLDDDLMESDDTSPGAHGLPAARPTLGSAAMRVSLPAPGPAAPRPTPMPMPMPMPTPMPTAGLDPAAGRGSFAPAPPMGEIDPRTLVTGRVGPPRILVFSIPAYVALVLVAAAINAEGQGQLFAAWGLARGALAAPMIGGRGWARASTLTGAIFGLLAGITLVLQPLEIPVRAGGFLLALAEAWWLYVLSRRDVSLSFVG